MGSLADNAVAFGRTLCSNLYHCSEPLDYYSQVQSVLTKAAKAGLLNCLP